MENLSQYFELIDQTSDSVLLEQIKTKLLGKNGIITNELKKLAGLSFEEKKIIGTKLNEFKNAIETKIKIKLSAISQNKTIQQIDYTIPYAVKIGKLHPISISINKLKNFFHNFGFNVVSGPDIEDIYYNFEALNIPKEHPTRDNNDTFYIDSNKILRTHTTCVQIRLLEELKNANKTNQDIRSYSIGRTYRNDSHDATHSCSFHQIEGIVIEENASLAHLKWFIEKLCEEFFEKKIPIKFRKSYFPFTTPSCEADITINNKTLELGGCGIIHPNILEKFGHAGKIGFAFGFGLERIIMIKYNIHSLHDLYNNQIPTLNYISCC